MAINPYLFFNGNCDEAFKFYAKVLNGKIEAMLPHAGTPAEEHVPAEWRDKIMHASLEINGEAHALMASDAPGPESAKVSILIDDPKEAERVFAELSEGGTVTMPMEETFWALRFGMLTDKFGTPWMVNCSKPM
jgi:PhnB protein